MYKSTQTVDSPFDRRLSHSPPFFATWEPTANRHPIRVVSEKLPIQNPEVENDDQARPHLIWLACLAVVLTFSLLVLGFVAVQVFDALLGIGREVARYRFEGILQGIAGR